MPARLVDANIILRYLTDEPAEQAERVARLFGEVTAGTLEILIEDVVAAEVVWTLSSYYRMARGEIADVLLALIADRGVHNPDKACLQSALVLFGENNIDFADALLAARALKHDDPEIYSFDRDFDRIPGIHRKEPD